RACRDDGQAGVVVLHTADRAHRTNNDALLDRFSPHAAALDLVQTHLDGLAVILLLALVDRDVVHPHPVLLRSRTLIRQSHWIAVIQNLFGTARLPRRSQEFAARAERRLFILVHRNIVAATRILFRLG